MQNATDSVELPVESIAQVDVIVIFPSTVFESFVTVIVVVRRVILWVIGQSQVLVDFAYPGGVAVWAVFVAVAVGYIVVPCWRFGRFDLWLPTK